MLDIVWERLAQCAGETFVVQNGGGKFTYEMWGDTLKLSDSNLGITKALLYEAVRHVPLENALSLQRLQLASQLYALLTDSRIREGG